MLYCECDECGTKSTEDVPVTVKGYPGREGRITLPDKYHLKHFCSKECFESWMKKELE